MTREEPLKEAIAAKDVDEVIRLVRGGIESEEIVLGENIFASVEDDSPSILRALLRYSGGRGKEETVSRREKLETLIASLEMERIECSEILLQDIKPSTAEMKEMMETALIECRPRSLELLLRHGGVLQQVSHRDLHRAGDPETQRVVIAHTKSEYLKVLAAELERIDKEASLLTSIPPIPGIGKEDPEEEEELEDDGEDRMDFNDEETEPMDLTEERAYRAMLLRNQGMRIGKLVGEELEKRRVLANKEAFRRKLKIKKQPKGQESREI
jgi:hypothetical protein